MRNLKFWFPFLGYSVIIFCISSLPSDRVTFTRFFWDKALHVAEYSVLGVCAAYALINTRKWHIGMIWAASTVLCFTYGLSDEFHQSFVFGRESSIYDAFADLIGSAIGAGAYLLLKQRVKTKATIKKETV